MMKGAKIKRPFTKIAAIFLVLIFLASGIPAVSAGSNPNDLKFNNISTYETTSTADNQFFGDKYRRRSEFARFGSYALKAPYDSLSGRTYNVVSNYNHLGSDDREDGFEYMRDGVIEAWVYPQHNSYLAPMLMVRAGSNAFYETYTSGYGLRIYRNYMSLIKIDHYADTQFIFLKSYTLPYYINNIWWKMRLSVYGNTIKGYISNYDTLPSTPSIEYTIPDNEEEKFQFGRFAVSSRTNIDGANTYWDNIAIRNENEFILHSGSTTAKFEHALGAGDSKAILNNGDFEDWSTSNTNLPLYWTTNDVYPYRSSIEYDGDRAWSLSQSGEITATQSLDATALSIIRGKTGMFSAWFRASSGEIARAEIHYYSGSWHTIEGEWIPGRNSEYIQISTTGYIPEYASSVKVVIRGYDPGGSTAFRVDAATLYPAVVGGAEVAERGFHYASSLFYIYSYHQIQTSPTWDQLDFGIELSTNAMPLNPDGDLVVDIKFEAIGADGWQVRFTDRDSHGWTDTGSLVNPAISRSTESPGERIAASLALGLVLNALTAPLNPGMGILVGAIIGTAAEEIIAVNNVDQPSNGLFARYEYTGTNGKTTQGFTGSIQYPTAATDFVIKITYGVNRHLSNDSADKPYEIVQYLYINKNLVDQDESTGEPCPGCF